jgi:predicted dithiol-disulfide oxidoreductase (DUF899 family)
MAESTITTSPTVVSPEEWRAALDQFSEREREVQQSIAALNAERQKLPIVAVDADYAFEGPDSPATLAGLFNGQRQLVIYHFMFAPEWDEGCPGCTGYTNGIGETSQLREQETEFVLVSRAPVAKLQAWKAKHGWTMPWYSGETRFSEDMGALPGGNDMPTINVFVKDDEGKVYRAYESSGPSLETTMGQKALLELTPRGADPLG